VVLHVTAIYRPIDLWNPEWLRASATARPVDMKTTDWNASSQISDLVATAFNRIHFPFHIFFPTFLSSALIPWFIFQWCLPWECYAGGKDCIDLKPRYLRNNGKGKGKAIPLEALTGTEGSRRLRLPDFGTWSWQDCQPYAPAAFTPRNYSWCSFLLEAESTPVS
jgi:hypothetical protein